jgi:hypothetical protein
LRFTALTSVAVSLVLSLGYQAGAELICERDGTARKDHYRIPERSTDHEPAVTIHHLGKNPQGKQVAESRHFRIIHGQSKQLVEKIIREAEHIRPAIHRQWFGDVSVEWDGKVLIYLHDSHKLYADKTKQWNALGHARTLMLGNEISLRSVHLPWGVPNFFEDLMPHELTHAVMAVRLKGRTPRWANEGMAMMSETPESQERMLSRLDEYRKNDDLFALSVLMTTEEQEQTNTLEYYSQSLSLVRYLVGQRDNKTFTSFIRDSLVIGYERALRAHYGIENYAQLDRRWREYAFGAGPLPSAGFARAMPASRWR